MKSPQVLIGEVVAATEAAILPTVIYNLEETKGFETAVNVINYKYGPEAEVTAMIQRYQNSPTMNDKDFPLIWAVEDFRYGQNGDFQTVTIPALIIAFGTKGDYMSADREVQTFNTVLRPIYNEFLKQLARKREFRIYDPVELYRFEAVDRKHWGRPEDSKAEGVFNGHVDAIEIRNLELTLNNYCN